MKDKAREKPARVGKGKISAAKEIACIALGVSLITVCAWISIPVLSIPYTLQTLAVPLVGALLGWKRGLAAVASYILMGLIGIPVFSNFNAGAGALFGATGGYILGFIFAVLVSGLFKLVPVKNKWARCAMFYGANILGMVICYAFGTAWFSYMYECTLVYALTMCVVPYLIADAVKLAAAAVLGVRLEKYVK